MIYFDTFAFYTLFCSDVLIYGVGINKIADFQTGAKQNITFFTKIVLSIFITTIISWGVISTVLVPLKLIELYPVVSLLIFVCIVQDIASILADRNSGVMLLIAAYLF